MKLGDLLYEVNERPAAGMEPPVLTLTERNGFVRQSERFKKRLATEDTSRYKLVRRDDIAFNPYLLWAGAVAHNTIADEGITSPLYPTFRAREGFHPPFIARLLLAPQTIAMYDGIAFGSIPRRRRTSTADFLSLAVPDVPVLEEQRRIAAILETADGMRSNRKAVLANFNGLNSALFTDMFGGLEATVPFGELIIGGPSNGLYKPAAHYGSGSPILRIDSFDAGRINPERWQRVRLSQSEVSRFGLQLDDIIINRVNALSHLGKSALVRDLEEPSVYESNMMRLRVDARRVLPSYVVAWMQTDSYKRQVLRKAKKAINQASINQADVRSLLMPVPPLEAQTTFVARADSIDVQRAAVQRALTADEELFASLQSRAFSGKL